MSKLDDIMASRDLRTYETFELTGEQFEARLEAVMIALSELEGEPRLPR